MQYDVFISHSSKDKEAVARPLAQALQDRGLQVWLDEEQLQVGDSIRRAIDSALSASRFGIVILSPAYLDSEWGQKELDAFFAKEKHQTKSILPIYHGVNVEDVERHWPMLADKISLNTQTSIDKLADNLQQSIQSQSQIPVRLAQFKSKSWWPSNNGQWLIGLIVALAAIVIPIWFTVSSNSSEEVSVKGNISGSTIIGTQNNMINKVEVDFDEAAVAATRKLIAEELLKGNKQSLQEKDAEIERLTVTVTRLEQQAADPLKQRALTKLGENKPEEAAQLLKQSLAERHKAQEVRSKNMAKDWLDVGNIVYLNSSQEALDAYSNAADLDPNNTEAWNSLGRVYFRQGELDKAHEAYKKVLALAWDDDRSQAVVYSNIGLIYQTQGELNKAEDMYKKALKIDEKLDNKVGVASLYGNLGMIYQMRGEFSKAENIHHESLKIYESLGHHKGMAIQNGHLGLIYQERDELDKAEVVHRKSLEINKDLGHQEGMAIQYGNLGLIYLKLGDLEKAKTFFLQSFEINKNLNRQEGMAAQYGNLGVIYRMQGELDKAESFFLKSLKIYEILRSQEGIASSRSNLSLIYETHDQLDKAKTSLQKRSVRIEGGRPNIGMTYQTRGELGKVKSSVQELKAIEKARFLDLINENFGSTDQTRSTQLKINKEAVTPTP